MAAVDTDSDDSELEGVLTNVVRAIMRPPGHSGKAKRGHLCFDSSYETGNLGRIDFVAEHEYDLLIRPDTSNPRFRFWFNFTVDNAQAGQLAIFNIVNLHKTKNLFSLGLTPVVRSTTRPGWNRVPARQVYYHNSIEHRGGHLILSFSFCFDVEKDVYQFALSYPYSYTRSQAFLAHIEEKAAPCCRKTILAQSVMKRKCDLLTITNPRNMTTNILEVPQHISLNDLHYSKHGRDERTSEDEDDEGQEGSLNKLVLESSASKTSTVSSPRGSSADGGAKRVVVMMARVHAAESPASYVIQGMIEMLMSEEEVANKLREHVVFKIIPMLNPDGVYLGNYRTTLMGVDLNRRWGNASPYAHPTLHATRTLILNLNKCKWGELDLVLDFHATNSKLGTFIYGNSYDDVYRHERHIVFPKMVSHACPDYNSENTIYNKDPLKAQSIRRWLCNNLKETVNVYSIHTSLLGFQETKEGPIVVYNENAYYKVGRNLVRAILDYYQFLGIIPFSLPDALPLHDLPRLRPGSPTSLKPRASSARARFSEFIGRKTGKIVLGDTESVSEHSGASSDTVDEITSQDSSESSDEDKFSNCSRFLVKIVQQVERFPESQSGEEGYERPDSSLPLPLPPGMVANNRRLPATTHVHLYPGKEFDDEPPSVYHDANVLKGVLKSAKSSSLSDKGMPTEKPLTSRKAAKLISWREPVASDEGPQIKFRYLDFKSMTSKLKKKRRRSRRPSMSPSRWRQRPRRKLRLKSKRRKRPLLKKSDLDPTSYVRAAEEGCNDEEDDNFEDNNSSAAPAFSRSNLKSSKISNIKRIDVNQLTVGGLTNSRLNSDSWTGTTIKKSLQNKS